MKQLWLSWSVTKKCAVYEASCSVPRWLLFVYLCLYEWGQYNFMKHVISQGLKKPELAKRPVFICSVLDMTLKAIKCIYKEKTMLDTWQGPIQQTTYTQQTAKGSTEHTKPRQHNTRHTFKHSLYNKIITTYRLITISLRQSNTVVLDSMPLFCPVIIGCRDKYWTVTAFSIAHVGPLNNNLYFCDLYIRRNFTLPKTYNNRLWSHAICQGWGPNPLISYILFAQLYKSFNCGRR